VASLLLVQQAKADTFTVGGDASCNFTDLHVALYVASLNGPGMDIIRVARNQTYIGEFLIDSQSVTIVGGYDDCSDTTASGQTLITRAWDQRQ
jgi:hypothetical protein